MRRFAPVVLAGLGMFLITVAVALPVFVVGQVLKFPLNEFETATLTGTNVQYFSPSYLTEETGVKVRATYTIKGDAQAGNGSTTVWNEVSYAYDETNGQVQAISTRRAAFDRKTAQLVNCCGANVAGKKIRQSGIVGWVFPMGAKKQTYQVFDTTLDKPMPFVYSGTATTDGIATYKYVENVPPTQFATLPVPGYFVGSSASTITAPEYYQTLETYWVDPSTGALLNVNEFEELTLHNPVTGATGLVLYKGDLTETPASLQQIVGLDSGGRNELSLLDTILPLVLGIVGGLVFVAGVLLHVRNRQRAMMPPPLVGVPQGFAGQAEDVPITTDFGVVHGRGQPSAPPPMPEAGPEPPD
jgi:hypothetical protein